MADSSFTNREVIRREIHRGEPVPKWLVVRHRDKLLRVAHDDYVQWANLGPSKEAREHLDALAKQREEALVALRKVDAQIAIWRKAPEAMAPFTGMSDTLQAVAINATGEGFMVRVFRSECFALANDQDIPKLREWVEKKDTGKLEHGSCGCSGFHTCEKGLGALGP